MKPIDLLKALGNVKDTYVISAEKFRQGKQHIKVKHISSKRVWMIAAAIVLSLLLVGCAIVYILSLQDMAFGTRTQEYYDGSSQEITLLSIQGIQGSPGYKATKEWYEWLETYDTDLSVYHSEEAFSEDFGDDYYAYNLYSREMKDKLDEICQKYGLELLGKMYIDPDIEAGCKALQIPGIFRPGAAVEEDFRQICYYANGSFDLEGDVSLNGQESHIVSFRCHRKNAFSDLISSVGSEGSYEEWIYTTSYGTDVLMVLDHGGVRGNAHMYVEQGEYVFLFAISEFDDRALPDKEMMEAYAEAFDFTVQPQRVSAQEIQKTEERKEEADADFATEQKKKQHGFMELGYDSRIKFELEYVVNPELLSFAVLDLEGNGTEDLLIGQNGYIRVVYTTKDGGSQHMMSNSVMYMNTLNTGTSLGVGEFGKAGASYIYLCENNGLAYVFDLEGDGVAYHFASVRNGELVWTDRIVYDPVAHPEEPWTMRDEDPRSHPITEEEFNSIRDSYKRIALDMHPISQYPLKDNSPSEIKNGLPVYKSYNELSRERIEYRINGYYQLHDLDGDGQQELILQEGTWTGVFTMKDGAVKQLVSGLDVKLCQGNILAVTRDFLDGNKAYLYYRIVDGSAVLVDYLRYDTDRNPNNLWLKSNDNSGQDYSMDRISKMEFESIRNKYVPIDMPMKSVSQYPFQ